jgi:alpha-tubulin suppressor-like RCC1 family protein
VPEKVVDLDGIPIADIAAGGWHSLALSRDGQIYVWGRGEYGRLGVGDRTGSSKLRPHPVRGLEAHTIVQVRGGQGGKGGGAARAAGWRDEG